MNRSLIATVVGISVMVTALGKLISTHKLSSLREETEFLMHWRNDLVAASNSQSLPIAELNSLIARIGRIRIITGDPLYEFSLMGSNRRANLISAAIAELSEQEPLLRRIYMTKALDRYLLERIGAKQESH